MRIEETGNRKIEPRARPDGFNKMNTVRIGKSMTANTSESKSLLMSPDDFRDAFGGALGRNFIYEQIRTGNIRHIRIGRKILIMASEVNEWPLRLADEQQMDR